MPQALPMLAYYGATAMTATAGWATFAAFAVSVVVADYQKQSAADKARAQAARDRTVNIRSGVAPRKLVLGTARLGGAVMYGEFVGPELEYLDMVVALHHGDAGRLTEVLGAYFDDEFVAAADLVDGVPTTGKYNASATLGTSLTEVQTLTATATITLPYVPSGDVYAIHNLVPGAVGEALSQVGLTVASVVGAVVTLTAPITGEVWVTYTTQENPQVPLRVQWTTGDSAQASTTWAGVSTPKWTADHRLRGVSYLRTLMRPENRVFATGTPQVSLVARAADGVWDPRTSTYVNGTSNPALLAAWFRMLPKRDGGFSVLTDWIDWPTVAAAANICDELLSVKKLDGTGYENVRRYECNTVLNLELPAADNLRIILGAMAGDFPFTGGKYRCYAGAFRAAAVTLTDDDVSGDSAISFAPSNGAAAPPNTITARIYNRAKGWVEDGAPAVVNSTYVTADGREEVMEIDLPACTDTRQANYLMGVRLEQMRPAMAGSLTVKGRGANLALLDTVQLDLAGYEALDGLTFEIRRRTNHWNGTYTIELTEVKASTYALDADRFTPPSTNDPGDTSGLWNVTPVTLTSVVNATLTQSDGSHLDRALVTWAAHPQSLVNPGGAIEVRYRAPEYEWLYAAPVPGDQTTTYIGPLGIGMVVFVEARARNSLGVVSSWSGIDPFTVTGTNDVPSDVTGLAGAIKPGQVLVSWDDVQGLETELRYSAVPGSWAGATFLWAGIGSDYKHARPANGTYRVWAAHRNRNFYSAAPQYVDITVDDTIDGGTGGALLLRTDRFPFFSFSTGTTHTAQPPGDALITITAWLLHLVGTVAWSAVAYDARTGGTSLGAVSLTGTGNERTLSAAQFVAAGTSGSVRRVRVTATHSGGATDYVDVLRQDSTTTAPFLFLSNPRHAVPTDEAGEYGDYSGASTDAQVWAGLTDLTSTHSISITPDSGVTATINGGAGPVTGTAVVVVAVSDMTIPDGAVLIEADDGVNPVLSASFVLSKQEASGMGYRAYFEPYAEIVLPVLGDGSVATYDGATTNVHVIKGGNFDDTDQWSKPKTDRNVVSTLTGNRIDIIDWPELGETGTNTDQAIVNATGWARAQSLVWGDGVWLTLGYHGSTTWQHIKRSVDFGAWVDVDVGTAGEWEFGAYGDDRFIVPDWRNSSAYVESTDKGLTWTARSFGVSRQWVCMGYGAGRWMLGAQGTVTGRTSTNGGSSWADVTFPAQPQWVTYAGSRWVLKDVSDVFWESSNGGASWSTVPDLAGAAAVRNVAGRAVALFSGTLAKYREGSAWISVTLSQSYTLLFSQVLRGVLYLIGADGKLQYTVDGKAWSYSGGSAGTVVSVGGMRDLCIDIDDDALRSLDTTLGLHNTTPLLSTSNTTGSVRLDLAKPGEQTIPLTLIVRKGAAVGDTYQAYATPGILLLTATSDGVVTTYANAVMTAGITKNGSIDDTANWTWSFTTTDLTPSSGSSNVVTITAMDDAAVRGTISYRASKAGQDDITGTLFVDKVFGLDPSGPRIGGAYDTVTETATQLTLRFKGDGRVQKKVGSGGSFVDVNQWAGAVRASNSAYWLKIIPAAGSHALASGTVDTYLALTTDRDFVLDDATSGTHRFGFQVLIAEDGSGTNAVLGYGAIQLIVPP